MSIYLTQDLDIYKVQKSIKMEGPELDGKSWSLSWLERGMERAGAGWSDGWNALELDGQRKGKD